ncbi:hypothetical protein [Nesterenkonia alkaliphila]|uniref:Uncharacterized protein n=1 Tax=Nesterenkonia alkaliphila TaxID=1463631 RepID=A0A7K1UH00_9MICC|nr:hypothetical protein [Nesterenkonia alkaliphila]MVT25738.1 hypothetical protein [Nesterenkonia alkaliphila]
MSRSEIEKAQRDLDLFASRMQHFQRQILEHPVDTEQERANYNLLLAQGLGPQCNRADNAAYLLGTYLDQAEAAEAMEAYRDAVAKCIPSDGVEGSAPVPPRWRTLRAGLQDKLNASQLSQLGASPAMQQARHASAEAALMSWQPDNTPAATLSATKNFTEALGRWQAQCSVAELHGEPLVYDSSIPIQRAVEQVLTHDQRRLLDRELIQAKTLLTREADMIPEAEKTRALATLSSWQTGGVPPIPDRPAPTRQEQVSTTPTATGPLRLPEPLNTRMLETTAQPVQYSSPDLS